MLAARSVRSRLLRATGLVHPEVIIFDVTHRCNSRCVGCAYREPEANELPWPRWVGLAKEARELGFRELMLTGGEPLAHPDIALLLPALAQHLPVSLITNGLALAKHADLVRRTTTHTFVSWDAASEEGYERIRGVRGFGAVRSGVRALAGHHAHARVTVWAENVRELHAIRLAAEAAGFAEMSLLAADTTSGGFGPRLESRGTPPQPSDIPALAAFLESVRADPFVVMSDHARERLLLLASGGQGNPRCNAPWNSGVVDPTGAWRHCFFLPTAAHTREGLRGTLRTTRPERLALHPATNPTCARCVCWRG